MYKSTELNRITQKEVKMEAKTFRQKEAALHLEDRNTDIHSTGDLDGTGLRFTTAKAQSSQIRAEEGGSNG